VPAVLTAIVLLATSCENDQVVSGGASYDTTVPFLTIGGGADEEGFGARRTNDGGFLVVGAIGKPQYYFRDLYAVRTDANGNVLSHNPVRRGETNSYVFSTVPTTDGGLAAITTRSNTAVLVKFASDGSLSWERDYGTHVGASWYSLCPAGDGFLIAASPDVLAKQNTIELFLTDAEGHQRDQKEWPSSNQRPFTAAQAADGSFLLAGGIWTTPSNLDIFISRTRPGSLEEDWSRTIGGENTDYAMLVIALHNDAVLFGARNGVPNAAGHDDYYLMRLLSDGSDGWSRNINQIGYVYAMTPTHDSGIALVSHTSDRVTIARLDGGGSVIWDRAVEKDGAQTALLSITPDDKGYVAAGFTQTDDDTDLDIMLVRINDKGAAHNFPDHTPECRDPVTPPAPVHLTGTQRAFSVVHDVERSMKAIWAASPNFVVAVGDSGYVTHYDGNTWSPIPTDTRDELYDVFGFSEEDVFAAGRDGTILHYDGTAWAEMPSTATSLYAMWGAAPDDVWAGGVQLLHYDGTAWTDVTPKGWLTALGMAGITATDLYVSAYRTVLHFDGCTWRVVYETDEPIRGIHAVAGPQVYVVGDDGFMARHATGSWEVLDPQSNDYFTAVWARSKDDVFVAGNFGFAAPYALHWFNGTSWAEQSPVSAQALLDIVGTADGHLFGITSYGQVVRGTP
jgi:hypothetical protein